MKTSRLFWIGLIFVLSIIVFIGGLLYIQDISIKKSNYTFTVLFENVQGSSLIELVRAGLLLVIFFTGLIDSSLLVSQILVVHALMNIILISILFPVRKIFLLVK